jgi:hypothetical protein
MKGINLISNHFFSLLIMMITISTAKSQPFDGFANFDGIDDEFVVSGYPIPTNSNFTIEFWFKPCQDSTNPTQVILGNSDNLEINYFTMFTGTNAYQLCARFDINSHVCHQDHQYYYDPLWHHIAVTYNKPLDVFNMYFDGIDGTLANYNYNFQPWPSLTLGVGTYQTFFYKHFKGYMDELRISNTIRYNMPFTPTPLPFMPDANTIGLWHFDETNPVTFINDYSGHGLNLIPSGNVKTIHLNSLIIQTNSVLSVADTFATYQWINCASDGIPFLIPGETNATFAPTVNGSYAVDVSNGSCTLRSSCYSMNTVGINESNINSGITIYPNPAKDILIINKGNNTELLIELNDICGKLLFFKTTDQSITSINLHEFAKGIYFIKLSSNQTQIVKKVIKE